MAEPNERNGQEEHEVHLLDLAAVFLRGWRTVAGTTGVALLLGTAFVLLRPSEYSAETVIVPSSTGGGNSALSALSSQVPGMLGDLMPRDNTNERLIMAVIKSRSLRDAMVARVGRGQETAIRRALRGAEVEDRRDDGSIAIRVSARKPGLAESISNQYPALINEIVARTSTEAAHRKQAFLERQLAAAREQLVRSEQQLVSYQKQQDAPDVQTQAQQTVTAAAALQQQINEQEVRVSQLRRTVTPDNPQLRAAEAQLSTRRAQLSRLTSGGGGQIFLPLNRSSELRAATARLAREFQKDEQVYISLTAALAQVRIDANNTLPVVSVLDPGVEPREPARAFKAVILVASTLLGFLIGVVLVFAREQFRRARHSPAGESFVAEWRQLRGRAAGHARGNGRVAVGARE